MICPKCHAEYREGFPRCADCGIPLVEPEAADLNKKDSLKRELMELITVFSTTDASKLAIVKSLLEDAEVPYFSKGEILQNFFGAGTLGGFSLVGGLMEIQVSGIDAPKAKAIIQEFKT